MPFFSEGLGFERVSCCGGLFGCCLATVHIFTTVLSYPGMYVGGGGANISVRISQRTELGVRMLR